VAGFNESGVFVVTAVISGYRNMGRHHPPARKRGKSVGLQPQITVPARKVRKVLVRWIVVVRLGNDPPEIIPPISSGLTPVMYFSGPPRVMTFAFYVRVGGPLVGLVAATNLVSIVFAVATSGAALKVFQFQLQGLTRQTKET
jgi:hypothetical protein